MGIPSNQQSTSHQELDVQLKVRDLSGQKSVYVPRVPSDSTVGELIESSLSRMKLPANDSEGRRLTYQARLEREGRHMHASEVIGDAVQLGDNIVLHPNVDAGRR